MTRQAAGVSQAPPRTATLIVGAIAALTAFAALTFTVLEHGAPAWDRALFRTFYMGETTGAPGAAPNDSEMLDALMPFLNRAAHGPAIALLVAIFVTFFALTRRWRIVAFLVAASSIVLLAGELKTLFGRPAPFESHGGVTFPSGHGMGSMAIALAVAAALATTPLRWPAVAGGAVFVAAVAIAVIADGGHWPSDVLGGWLLAVAWVSALVAAFRVQLSRPSP